MSALDRAKAFDYVEIFYRNQKLSLEFEDLHFPSMLQHAGVDMRSIQEVDDLIGELRLVLGNALGASLERNVRNVHRIVDEMAKGAHEAKRHVVISASLVQGLQQARRKFAVSMPVVACVLNAALLVLDVFSGKLHDLAVQSHTPV